MARNILLSALAASSVSAANILVSSYAGSVTTLKLAQGFGAAYGNNTAATLNNISSNSGCGASPSWLEFANDNIVYCIDEGLTTPNGSINTLRYNDNGTLVTIFNEDTISGPVSSIFYNKGNASAVALAHYGASAISTFDRTPAGHLSPLQNITFSTPHGPRPEQEASHPHEAILDPTGKYLLFPDLGADEVHIYCFDPTTSILSPHDSLKTANGTGPRHGVFWSPDNQYGSTNSTLYFFLIHELGNIIVSYKVSYPAAGGLAFTKVDQVSTYGPTNTTVDVRWGHAAEIVVSPDNKFLVASNRNITQFNLTNPNDGTPIASDSLISFKPTSEGKLVFQQLFPAGGIYPRHFELNQDGSLLAVGNQLSGSVVIWNRDIKTGKVGDLVALTEGLGNVTNVRWVKEKGYTY